MKKYLCLLILFSGCFPCHFPVVKAEENGVSPEDAWNMIKAYRFGDELAPLLMVELDIRHKNISPESQAEIAARLASFLNDDTTYAGRQFVCLQLRQVGTAAQVPILAEYLNREEDSDNARMALQAIAGEESLIPLRKALKTFQGKSLTGIMESLAARRDEPSIPAFIKLTHSDDKAVARSALTALGSFEEEESTKTLLKPREDDLEPVRQKALIRVANTLVDQGNADKAKEIFKVLAETGTLAIVRRAAFEGTLRTLPENERSETVFQWFFEDDAEKNVVAATHLTNLSSSQFDKLFEKMETMNPRAKIVFLEIAGERENEKLVGNLRKTLETGNETERLAALRAFGTLKTEDVLPLLIEALKDPALQKETVEALKQYPDLVVCPAMMNVLDQPELRNRALDVLAAKKYYAAIDPLVIMAQTEAPSVFVPVIDALAKICDPDNSDIPRLLNLYLACRPGAHRDNVERAIVIVSEKNPDPTTRADLLLKHLRDEDGNIPDSFLVAALPLLGKVGNPQVAEILFPLLASDRPDLQRAAVRALCNWPDATYHEKLWTFATSNPSRQYAQWALRAYIRVVTLKSERPDSETLAMLQEAMKIANRLPDRQWCLSRATVIRTMESVEWVAGYLDDPDLAQTACDVLAKLAHHRFLREPNMERFEPILIKVEKTAKDAGVIESVRKSRLGM